LPQAVCVIGLISKQPFGRSAASSNGIAIVMPATLPGVRTKASARPQSSTRHHRPDIIGQTMYFARSAASCPHKIEKEAHIIK
jgi:hypothetical protein